MKNKVLVKLIIPELDYKIDVFIPVNEIVFEIKKIFVKAISELIGVSNTEGIVYVLVNKDNSKIYKDNEIIINTDIRNGSELLLISLYHNGITTQILK